MNTAKLRKLSSAWGKDHSREKNICYYSRLNWIENEGK